MSEESLDNGVKDLDIQDDVLKLRKVDSIPLENDTVEELNHGSNNSNTPVVSEEAEEDQGNDDGDDGDDDDDDDFGAFSDASFDEFEQSQPEQSQSTATTTFNYTQLPQSQLTNNTTDLQDTLNTLLSQSFPDKLPVSIVPENTDVLNERSKLLLERLTALPYLKPHNWKKSSIRRQLLVTLGIPDNQMDHPKKRNLDDGMQYQIKSFEELGFKEEDAVKYKAQNDEILDKLEAAVKDDDELNRMGLAQLDDIVDDYKAKIEEVSRLLAVWEYEQKNLEADNSTFEGVVENLVGHTQRLRREETLQSLKKEAHKSKGLGAMFKKKSKK